MSEYRRRRIEPDEPKGGGGLPIFPLIVLVIFAGLLLGGGLAKFLGRGGAIAPTPAPTFTPLPTEAAASPTPQLTPTPAPKPTPHASPSATPSARPSASAAASATPGVKPTETPSGKPSATPAAAATEKPTPAPTEKPTPRPTEKPTPEPTERPTPTPSPTPALVAGAATASHAAAIVRSYLTAMANGDSAYATGYLKRGLPTEDFMKGGRVLNVQATPNGDGSFFVTASMSSPGGSYTENFRVESGPAGLQITDHTPSAGH